MHDAAVPINGHLSVDSVVCKAENNPLLSGSGSLSWPDTCAISSGAKYFISATVFFAAVAVSSFKEQKALEEELAKMDPDLQADLLSHP